MASNTSEIECEGPELRRLGFVRVIAIGVFVCASSLYDYAKENHRLLTLPARMVEFSVKKVLGPVCFRFRNLPDDLLVVADILVNEIAPRLTAYSPYFAKRLVRPFKVMADKVIDKAVIAANEARARGPESAAQFVAAEFKKFVVMTIAKSWFYLNRFRLFRAWASLLVPGVIFLTKAYNQFVWYTSRSGYPLVGYLPAIPTQDLKKAVRLEARRYLWDNMPLSPQGISELSFRYYSD